MPISRFRPRALPFLVFFILLLGLGPSLPCTTRALAVLFGPHDVRSVFHVKKSENQNQVHYALHLDATCKPMGTRPVFAYWQRLRDGKRIADPLTGLATSVYGASDEQLVSLQKPGVSSVEMFVKALKSVRITIEVEKTAQGCTATPYTQILKQRARLSHAFLQLGALGLTVKYVDVVGYRRGDGARLAERHR
jgi:Domain of unknown function (DUF4833)